MKPVKRLKFETKFYVYDYCLIFSGQRTLGAMFGEYEGEYIEYIVKHNRIWDM